jgi:hypothetical protein
MNPEEADAVDECDYFETDFEPEPYKGGYEDGNEDDSSTLLGFLSARGCLLSKSAES